MHSVSSEQREDLVLVGHISGAHGIRGGIKVHPYSSDASALLSVKTWWLTTSPVNTTAGTASPDQVTDVEVLDAKRHGEDVVANLMGVVDREAAEALRSRAIFIRRSYFPILDDNEFYWIDLIGSAVKNLQDEDLGVVEGLIDNGAHPILRVVRDGKEYLIPFVDHIVPMVDKANKKLVVDWGLDY